ncbi:hypothetical protein [Nocardia sp. NPDC049526]|uniref:hypothetical protein n=1 Tax=Nocardia sp. NPDC049526 TaxID=3364316 RepID=UPI0037A1F5A5
MKFECICALTKTPFLRISSCEARGSVCRRPRFGEVLGEDLAHEVLVSHRDVHEGVFLVGHFHRDIDERAASAFGSAVTPDEVEYGKHAFPAGIAGPFDLALELGAESLIPVDQEGLDQGLLRPEMPEQGHDRGLCLFEQRLTPTARMPSV